MPGGRERGHVGADLGDDHLGGAALRRRGSCTAARRAARERARSAPRSRPRAGRSPRRGSRCGRGSARRSARAAARSGPPAPRAAPAAWRAACPRRARPAPRGRSCRDTSASSIARPDLPSMSRGDAVELDAGVLQHLVQPVGLALALADLRLAIAGQVAQRRGSAWAARSWRAAARPRAAGTATAASEHVGLAARDLLDVPGVDQHAARSRPPGSPTPASSRRRWPPSRPASTPCAASQSAQRQQPPHRRRELRHVLLAAARPRRARARTPSRCALCTSSAPGARRSSPSDLPANRRSTVVARREPRLLDESEGRAHRHQSGVPGKAPTPDYERAHRHQAKPRRRQATPARIAQFSSARGWPPGHDDYQGRPRGWWRQEHAGSRPRRIGVMRAARAPGWSCGLRAPPRRVRAACGSCA